MGRHPHFDDKGTLDWHTSYRDALAAARSEGKRVFIEMGREQCGNCRTLVSAIVPQPAPSRMLKEHFVALASDADDPEPEIIELVSEHLADGMMLPFVLFVDADGRFLGGSHGALRPDVFLSMLESAAG
ncbi:MAG: thioredoxin family protein [Planctomycetes bacterium]|nr:thioredoxin family protein [Planctomycetota bacterium]